MKIIISPSKTKKLKGEGIKNRFPKKTQEIIELITNLDVEEFAKKMKLNIEKAQKLHDFYKEFSHMPEGKAIFSYTGAVLKEANISENDVEYLNQHLYILSALYGILLPNESIKEYRLDFDNNIIDKNFWKDIVNEELKDEVIINLASKEYTKQIELPMIDICFTSKLQIKKARGKFLRILIDNKVESLDDLIKLDIFSHREENKYYFNIE